MQNDILIPTAIIPLCLKMNESITLFNVVKNKEKWLDTDEGKQYINKQRMANERLSIQKQIAKIGKIIKQKVNLSDEQLQKKNKDKRYRQELRLKAIELMGGQCSVCLIDDHDVLEFDHITPLLRRSSGIKTKGDTATVVIKDKDRQLNFQLLCSNCHTKKTRLNNEYEYKG